MPVPLLTPYPSMQSPAAAADENTVNVGAFRLSMSPEGAMRVASRTGQSPLAARNSAVEFFDVVRVLLLVVVVVLLLAVLYLRCCCC